jgi:hypothetical protein
MLTSDWRKLHNGEIYNFLLLTVTKVNDTEMGGTCRRNLRDVTCI